MTKELLLMGIIELVIFLLPLATFSTKVGSWQREIELKLKSLKMSDERQDSQYSTILSTMNDIQMSIVRMETKFEYMEKKQSEKD
jgi:hypothetical protein